MSGISTKGYHYYVETILKEKESITYAEWPKYDESKLMADTYTLVVQINGKLRDRIEVATDSTNDEIPNDTLPSTTINKGYILEFKKSSTVTKVNITIV